MASILYDDFSRHIVRIQTALPKLIEAAADRGYRKMVALSKEIEDASLDIRVICDIKLNG